MPKTKLDFISCLGRTETVEELGASLVSVLKEAAYRDDWDFVKEVIAGFLEEGDYNQTADWMYSKIPGQDRIPIV